MTKLNYKTSLAIVLILLTSTGGIFAFASSKIPTASTKKVSQNQSLESSSLAQKDTVQAKNSSSSEANSQNSLSSSSLNSSSSSSTQKVVQAV